MILPPPRATLFPYTTLFRSARIHVMVASRSGPSALLGDLVVVAALEGDPVGNYNKVTKKCGRSEEHTSELQSLRHLVCRLLLEKKKQKNQINRTQRTHTKTQ